MRHFLIYFTGILNGEKECGCVVYNSTSFFTLNVILDSIVELNPGYACPMITGFNELSEEDYLVYAEKTPSIKNFKSSSLNKEEAEQILNNGADVSNFGDPVEWQKNERTDRKIGDQ